MRPRLIAVATSLAVASASLLGPAIADIDFHGRGNPSHDRDPVTGYFCVTPGCDTIRMNEASCICQKENPYETRLKRLRLVCVQSQQGRWVACPVRPRYGRMVN